MTTPPPSLIAKIKNFPLLCVSGRSDKFRIFHVLFGHFQGFEGISFGKCVFLGGLVFGNHVLKIQNESIPSGWSNLGEGDGFDMNGF